jgi:hypothetical protein
MFEIPPPIQSPAKCEVHHFIPEVSKTTIHEAVTDKLRYRKLCARWVHKMLADDHKTKRLSFALNFLTRLAQEGNEILDSIVTGDETLGFLHAPEFKQQPLQWRHTHFPSHELVQRTGGRLL